MTQYKLIADARYIWPLVLFDPMVSTDYFVCSNESSIIRRGFCFICACIFIRWSCNLSTLYLTIFQCNRRAYYIQIYASEPKMTEMVKQHPAQQIERTVERLGQNMGIPPSHHLQQVPNAIKGRGLVTRMKIDRIPMENSIRWNEAHHQNEDFSIIWCNLLSHDSTFSFSNRFFITVKLNIYK